MNKLTKRVLTLINKLTAYTMKGADIPPMFSKKEESPTAWFLKIKQNQHQNIIFYPAYISMIPIQDQIQVNQ